MTLMIMMNKERMYPRHW